MVEQKIKDKERNFKAIGFIVVFGLMLLSFVDAEEISFVNVVNLLKDGMTNSQVIISFHDNQLHEGHHFFICNFTTLDDGETIFFSVTTPNSNYKTHMDFEIVGTSRTEVEIWEGSIISNGTLITPINSYRDNSYISLNNITFNSTISYKGVQIFASSGGTSGVNPSNTGDSGKLTAHAELILLGENTTTYYITSRQDGNIISYCGAWVEFLNLN